MGIGTGMRTGGRPSNSELHPTNTSINIRATSGEMAKKLGTLRLGIWGVNLVALMAVVFTIFPMAIIGIFPIMEQLKLSKKYIKWGSKHKDEDTDIIIPF